MLIAFLSQARTKSQSIAENRNEQPAQVTTFVAARPIAALLQGCDSAEAILELVELQGNSFQHVLIARYMPDASVSSAAS